MDDPPYTTPEEDPFYVQPPTLFQPRPRPSSMLDKWIQEQQVLPEPTGTPTHPYLAYPDLGHFPFNNVQDDACTLHSYDLVEDDDIPDCIITESALPLPSTPNGPRSNKPSKVLLTSSTFRNLNLSFRSSYSIGTPALSDDTTPSPRTSSRMSLFTRPSRQSTSVNTPQHARSSSLSTLNMSGPSQSPTVKATASTSKWRPSILGHFPQSSSTSVIPSDAQSRPSLSSGDTNSNASQTATTLDSDLPSTPSRPSFFESVRSRNRSSVSIFKPHNSIASSSSIWSQSQPQASRANLEEAITCLPEHTLDSQKSTLPRRIPFAPTSGLQYDNLLDDEDFVPNISPSLRDSAQGSVSFKSGGSLPRVGFASLSSRNHKKKKKLIISGIGTHETRKFEGVKRWCETFGEIRQIVRVPNGDLHIDFRRADVAETVCRVRAKVFIAGVGSVYLSWINGDRR